MANWQMLGLPILGEASNDYSGTSVSLSADGTTVAIGAPFNAGNGSYSGHVRVYSYSSNTWSQLGGDIDGEASDDNSGRSVSLSADGTTVAIGAPYNDGINGSDRGHVRVYKYNSTSNAWTQLGGDIDGEAYNDESGFYVSLSSHGTTVAIGAYANKGTSTNQYDYKGHVRVYKYISTSNTWTQLGEDINGEASMDLSGVSVSLSGDGTTVAIGAPYNDGINGQNSGHVRVYKYISNAWTQLGGDIDGETADDESGRSVSLNNDGTTLAIGALYNDGNGIDSGSVRVYNLVSPQPALNVLKAQNATKSIYTSYTYVLQDLVNSGLFVPADYKAIGYELADLKTVFTNDTIISTWNYSGRELNQNGIIPNGIAFFIIPIVFNGNFNMYRSYSLNDTNEEVVVYSAIFENKFYNTEVSKTNFLQ